MLLAWLSVKQDYVVGRIRDMGCGAFSQSIHDEGITHRQFVGSDAAASSSQEAALSAQPVSESQTVREGRKDAADRAELSL